MPQHTSGILAVVTLLSMLRIAGSLSFSSRMTIAMVMLLDRGSEERSVATTVSMYLYRTHS